MGNLNLKNPLAIFKLGKYGRTWTDLGKKAGLGQVTLIRLASRNKEDVKKIPLGTYLSIKEKLGVDLLDWDTKKDDKQK